MPRWPARDTLRSMWPRTNQPFHKDYHGGDDARAHVQRNTACPKRSNRNKFGGLGTSQLFRKSYQNGCELS
ncbi:hypothetical protein RRG08_020610 [Elysia crispata]|uniref:Uncharacterized protein n=1 Tax=Elysia crispata TaxID=231223 RepID=A0AAE1DF17_9GAST|nr:hypothetical protein RRG08_020610 [Elysia crispata]